MSVATITLESSNGDSVVVSAANDEFLDGDIILDTDPQGMYDTGFTVRTQSGAFETGGRITGESVPIREPVLPFWLTPDSRPRFQRLWGSPGNFQKVKCTWDGPSGPRFLNLKLAKEILYTTEGGFDADIDQVYHAVVSALAVEPMYEGVEDVAEWVNGSGTTGGTFTVYTSSSAGTFTLSYAGSTTSSIAHGASTATVQSALEALPSIGSGNVTVTGTPGAWIVNIPVTHPGMLTVNGSGLSPLAFSVSFGTLSFTLNVGGHHTAPISFLSSATTVRHALEELATVGVGGVSVSATIFGYVFSFSSGPLAGFLTTLFTGRTTAVVPVIRVVTSPNTSWFEVWNPTDQPLWLEWTFDPATSWHFPDFGFGQERKWGRTTGEDAARMIVTPALTQLLSVMSDPFQDTYMNADLSNAAGLFNGVEPIYAVPPYTGTEDDPILMPVICNGPVGAKATLRQRRFWSAESGLEA